MYVLKTGMYTIVVNRMTTISVFPAFLAWPTIVDIPLFHNDACNFFSMRRKSLIPLEPTGQGCCSFTVRIQQCSFIPYISYECALRLGAT